jgi:integrase
VQGLYLWVSEGGDIRRWFFRYTSPVTRRPTEKGIGPFPAISLAAARDKAHDLRKQIANGICPIAARRAKRVSATTFAECCEQWIATHKPSWRNGEHGKPGAQERQARVLLFNHGHAMANLPVANITPDHVQRCLQKVWDEHPAQGRRALDMFARVFDYATAKGMRSGANPASWKSCHQYRWPKRRSIDIQHHAALPYKQIPGFMSELRTRQERSTAAAALEFTILTACRSGEALGITWDEIDWTDKLWTLPATRTKQGRAHTIPLPERAVELLTQQRQESHGSDFVFTGYNRTRLADNAMKSLLKKMGVNVTVHGFRSTFRDWCGDKTDFKREHVEACLAHRVGNSVELAYRRLDAQQKRREILEAWSTYCERL